MSKSKSPQRPKSQTSSTADPYPEPDHCFDYEPGSPMAVLIDNYADSNNGCIDLDKLYEAITTPKQLASWIELRVSAMQKAQHVGTDTSKSWRVLESQTRSVARRLWTNYCEAGIDVPNPFPLPQDKPERIVETLYEWATVLGKHPSFTAPTTEDTPTERRWKKTDLLIEIERNGGPRVSPQTLNRILRDAELSFDRSPLSSTDIKRLAQAATKEVDTDVRRRIAGQLYKIAAQSHP